MGVLLLTVFLIFARRALRIQPRVAPWDHPAAAEVLPEGFGESIPQRSPLIAFQARVMQVTPKSQGATLGWTLKALRARLRKD
jgi:hypothetical protein